MIGLHFLQLLQDEGFGTIDALQDGLFSEKLPLNATGVAFISRGSGYQRGLRQSQDFDLYARGSSDILGADKLEKIKEYVLETYNVCEFPVTTKSIKNYKNAVILITSDVDNLGEDANGRIIFRIAGTIIYDKE